MGRGPRPDQLINRSIFTSMLHPCLHGSWCSFLFPCKKKKKGDAGRHRVCCGEVPRTAAAGQGNTGRAAPRPGRQLPSQGASGDRLNRANAAVRTAAGRTKKRNVHIQMWEEKAANASTATSRGIQPPHALSRRLYAPWRSRATSLGCAWLSVAPIPRVLQHNSARAPQDGDLMRAVWLLVLARQLAARRQVR